MNIKTSIKLAAVAAGAATLLAACAGGASSGADMNPAQLDALTHQIVQNSFHDKGIVKVSQALASDPTLDACNAADYEALMETLEVLADPAAMEELRRAKAGQGTYRKLDLDDEDFGL